MSSRRKQLQSTISQFYNQPIAQVSVELFLSVGAVIFFAIFAIRPTLLTMSDLIKEIEDKEKLTRDMDQKIAALSTVQTEYLEVEPRLVVLDQAIPPAPELEDTLKIIEKLASDNKLVIESMRVQEIPPEMTATGPVTSWERRSLPIVVNLIGDFLPIRQFVEDLKGNRRALIVDSMVFGVNDQRGERRLSATVTINMQYYGPKAAAATTPTQRKQTEVPE